MIVAFMGNIGSGKTTLINKIAEELKRFDIPYRIESESYDKNPFAKLYYKDPKKWAFHFQLFVLKERIKASNAYDYGETIVLQDRCYEEDFNVFVFQHFYCGNISKDEYSLLSELKQQAGIRQPKRTYWLQTKPEECLANIKTRGREEEAGIDLQYLQKINERYEFNLAYTAQKITNSVNLRSLIVSLYGYYYQKEFGAHTSSAIPLELQEQVAETVIGIKEEMLSGRMTRAEANSAIEKYKQHIEAKHKNGY